MAKYTEGSKFATSAGSGARQTLDLYKPSDFTTWKYSAPEQESQLLKIFIESFLSSKRV